VQLVARFTQEDPMPAPSHPSQPSTPTSRQGIARRASLAAGLVAAGSLALGGVAIADEGRNGGGHEPSVGGTVVSVASPSFTLKGRGDRTITVTTTDATAFRVTADATVADADPGELVDVHGARTDHDTVDARRIAIRPAPAATSTATAKRRHRGGHVVGTVVSNDAGVLTVDAGGDSPVEVLTDDVKKVVETTAGAFADVKADERVRATGDRTDERAITARRVDVDLTTHPVKPAPTTTSTTSTTAPATTTTTAAIQSASFATAGDEDAGASTSTTAKPARSTSRPAAKPATAQGNRGIVAGITGTDVSLTLADGSTLVVHTTATTAYVDCGDGTPADSAFTDLAVGDKVEVVGAKAGDGTVTARRIVITPEDRVEADRAHEAGDDGHRGGSGDGSRRASGGDDGSRRGPSGGRR
jgi:hypothetical protein